MERTGLDDKARMDMSSTAAVGYEQGGSTGVWCWRKAPTSVGPDLGKRRCTGEGPSQEGKKLLEEVGDWPVAGLAAGLAGVLDAGLALTLVLSGWGRTVIFLIFFCFN
jgi:hypothetical protein